MHRVSKSLVVSMVVVCLGVSNSFAGAGREPRETRVTKKPNPIVLMLRRAVARVFDGGDMSVPKP